jgi:heme exporter protein B
VVFGLAFGPGRTALRSAAPALLWLAVLFAGVLALRRSFEAETEDAALEGLVLAPADRTAIYVGKVLAVSVQLIGLEAVTLFGTTFLFGLAPADLPLVLGAFALGTVGLAAIGTLFGALAVRAQAREALFPLLLLPLSIPLLLAGIRATELAMSGPTGGAASWIGLLGAFAAFSVSAGLLAFEHLVED